jgi:hypothetical protein
VNHRLAVDDDRDRLTQRATLREFAGEQVAHERVTRLAVTAELNVRRPAQRPSPAASRFDADCTFSAITIARRHAAAFAPPAVILVAASGATLPQQYPVDNSPSADRQ